MAVVARLACILVAAVAIAAPGRASEGLQLAEQKIKAGLLYNFLKYTAWPQSHPIVAVCLFGGDPFDGHLAPMNGRTVNQSTIEVRAIETVDQARTCALVFVNAERKALWPELKAALGGKDVLTVSDFDGFTSAGGMIEFTHFDERVGVEINVDAVTAAHLTVEDRLLKLASAVRAPAQGH